MDDIQLDYAVPTPACARYVSLFYRFRACAARFDHVDRADRAQLRFCLAGEGEYRFIDGTTAAAPAAHLLGPTTGATRIVARGPVDVFGCGITPEGWAALLGPTAAAALRNRLADAAPLFGAPVEQAAVALASARDLAAMAGIAEALILALVRPAHDRLAAFIELVDGWLEGAPSPVIEDLILVTGLSRRQLERKCQAIYGAAPKMLARKHRALRTATAIVAGECGIGDVLDGGYYDQSHMIREVKHFVGLTPGQIAAAPASLAQRSIAARYAAEQTNHRSAVPI